MKLFLSYPKYDFQLLIHLLLQEKNRHKLRELLQILLLHRPPAHHAIHLRVHQGVERVRAHAMGHLVDGTDADELAALHADLHAVRV